MLRARRAGRVCVRPLNLIVRIQETRMLVFLKFMATFAAAMFAGAALYVNVAEHPARMTLDTKSAAMQWVPSYRRATWMQAPLALLSLLAGLGSWLLGGGIGGAQWPSSGCRSSSSLGSKRRECWCS